MVNRIIRNFEIKELIATGGMAAIYKAMQVSLDRMVAIKILHGHLAQDKDFITRFEREAKAAANLKHENIVNIIDFGKAEDVYFIAMEYVDGKSLKELISSVKFIPHNIALQIGFEISKGLDHAHQKGLVHRDIKPANILISYDGIVKIADFGLAQAQDLTSVTVTGSIVGTPAYMSPEQAAGKKVDHRTDIFSVGVVLYEMLTGIKPFAGENYSSVIHAIMTLKPRPSFDANPLIPKEVNDIIEKMLEKDLDTRINKIADVNASITEYFKQKNEEMSHRTIGKFVKNPDEHFKNLVEERKAKHFERAIFFQKQGSSKIDDAISEFSKVLHLDPNDKKAREYLSELRKKQAQKKPEKPKVVKKTEHKRVPVFAITVPIIVLAVIVAGFLIGPSLFKSQTELSRFGWVAINSNPGGADVLVDNVDRGLTPLILDSMPKKEYDLQIVKKEFDTYQGRFNVEPGNTTSVTIDLVRSIIPMKFGKLDIKSKPSGALVLIDNVNTGSRTPCLIDSIAEGSHQLKLIRDGYETIDIARTVEAGRTLKVNFTLKQIKATSVAETKYGYLKVRVDPWAKIYIDNNYTETTPIARPLKIAAGNHQIKLENPNCKTWQRNIKIAVDDTANIDTKLEPLDGFLKLTVEPWADVYIDGKLYETTPIAKPISLAPGNHVLKLINPSFKPYQETIQITTNKVLKKHVDLEKN